MPLAAHADWSVSPTKRWLAIAQPEDDGWRVRVEAVGPVAALLARLRRAAGEVPVALGVDAPIGLPLAYAARLDGGHGGFPSFLDSLTADSRFFQVGDVAAEIGPSQPFYPKSARAGVRRADLAAGLGLSDTGALLRRCERRTSTRPAAASLFWTLGANQVGKAAISLWRDLLLPSRRAADRPALWPFEGTLAQLLARGEFAVAETYPAEALRQLGLTLGSKRRQSDRRGLAAGLEGHLSRLGAVADNALQAEITDGFGADANGEDRFDALLGLLAMLQVIREPARDTLPDPATLRWEGWILGQSLTNP